MQTDIAMLIDLADTAFYEERFGDAIVAYTHAIENGARDFKVFFNIAKACEYLKDYDKAIQHANTVLTIVRLSAYDIILMPASTKKATLDSLKAISQEYGNKPVLFKEETFQIYGSSLFEWKITDLGVHDELKGLTFPKENEQPILIPMDKKHGNLYTLIRTKEGHRVPENAAFEAQLYARLGYFTVKGGDDRSPEACDKALACLNRAIILNRSYDWAYYFRCCVYGNMQIWTAAEQDVNVALLLNPKNPLYLSNRGEIYLRINKFSEAFKDINQSISLNPSPTASDYHNLWFSSIKLRKFISAVEAYLKEWEISKLPAPQEIESLVPKYVEYRQHLKNPPSKEKGRAQHLWLANIKIREINNLLKDMKSDETIEELRNPPSLKALAAYALKHHPIFKEKIDQLQSQDISKYLPDGIFATVPIELAEYVKNESFNNEVKEERNDDGENDDSGSKLRRI